MTNLYEYTLPGRGEETMDTLLRQKGVRIERIVSNEARTGWYDQTEDEWVVLLEGTAELQIGDERVPLRRGDTVLLKAHQRHRVLRSSEDALWLTVFMKEI
jgi:cupin 2 domain-containing protein